VRIITCIQDNIYLNWQAELLAWNCRQHGHNLTVLSGYTGAPSAYAEQLKTAINGYISIKDTRTFRGYAPSIQPHLLSKFVDCCQDEPILLVDSDVLFRSMDWMDGISFDKKTVYGSNVESYISADYLAGCDPHLLPLMAQVARCPVEIIQSHPHSIGAQYLLPNLLDKTFWLTVERTSNNLHALLATYSCSIHPVQTWTASMWAILWELYKRELAGQLTVATCKEMEFCWATEPEDRYHHTNILHCSGVTADQRHLFYKGGYTNTTPFHKNLSHVKPGTCSKVYAEAIEDYSMVRNLERLDATTYPCYSSSHYNDESST